MAAAVAVPCCCQGGMNYVGTNNNSLHEFMETGYEKGFPQWRASCDYEWIGCCSQLLSFVTQEGLQLQEIMRDLG